MYNLNRPNFQLCSCLLGHLSQSELALWLVELYKLSRPTLFFIPLKSDLRRQTLLFIPFKSDIKWLNYVQLSPGTVVAWAIVTQIRARVDWLSCTNWEDQLCFLSHLNLTQNCWDGQLSPGTVVPWAIVPPIRASCMPIWVDLFCFLSYSNPT